MASRLGPILGLVLIVPGYAATACGGQQGSPATSPVVEAPVTVVAPNPAARESTLPAVASAPSATAAVAGEDDDPRDAKPSLWMLSPGDVGGLGLSGVADGGGIGLGNIGTLGHGQGFGSSGSQSAPSLRQGATTVNGRLPPEVIQRIVRQNFGRFRLCYEFGLRSNPKLAGRVNVSFVIDASGAVKNVRDGGGSTLGDANVIACITRGFGNLSFPQPEQGEVSVSFPIVFTPGAPATPTPPAPSAAPKPPSK